MKRHKMDAVLRQTLQGAQRIEARQDDEVVTQKERQHGVGKGGIVVERAGPEAGSQDRAIAEDHVLRLRCTGISVQDHYTTCHHRSWWDSHCWFIEGFDTADLQETRALLEALGDPTRHAPLAINRCWL